MITNKERVVHLTSVHRRKDPRIFQKECKSLSKLYDVYLIIADGLGDEIINGIKIIDVGKEKSRLRRFVFSTQKIYKIAQNINAKIYHFHDPELIPIALKLRWSHKTIIFDIHEDIYEQIKMKEWFPKILLPFVLIIIKMINWLVSKLFYLILAETSYVDIYSKKTRNYITIHNYPKTEYLQEFVRENRTENGIFYMGAITNHRGLDSILDSLLLLEHYNIKFTIHLIGECNESINWVKYKKIKDYIKFYGYLNYKNGYEISKKCKIGLALLKPTGNYIKSLPTKMFEYMCVGLPVIASNFSLWKEIIEKYNCGICVNPENPKEIADAIQYIYQNPEIANKMGDNGRKATFQHYNWEKEKKKLFSYYNRLI